MLNFERKLPKTGSIVSRDRFRPMGAHQNLVLYYKQTIVRNLWCILHNSNVSKKIIHNARARLTLKNNRTEMKTCKSWLLQVQVCLETCENFSFLWFFVEKLVHVWKGSHQEFSKVCSQPLNNMHCECASVSKHSSLEPVHVKGQWISRSGCARVNLVLRVPWLFGQRVVARRVSPGDRPLTKQPEDTRYEIAHAVCLLALDDIMKKKSVREKTIF